MAVSNVKQVNPADIGQESRNIAGSLTSMRIDELISNLAIGMAEGQLRLDEASIRIAQFMSKAQVDFGKKIDDPSQSDKKSMIELGFSPTFYQFVDTILEIRVSLSSSFEEQSSITASDAQQRQEDYQNSSSEAGKFYNAGYNWGFNSRGWGLNFDARNGDYRKDSSYKRSQINATTVDATYAAKYNYNVEAASIIKTKIVPLPPPAILEEIIRARLEQEKEQKETERKIAELRVILPNMLSVLNELDIPTSSLNMKVSETNTLVTNLNSVTSGIKGLTMDHWSLLQTPEPTRIQILNASDSASQNASTIIGAFGDNDSIPGDQTDTVNTALTKIKSDVGLLKNQLQNVKDSFNLLYPASNQTTSTQTSSQNSQGSTT